MTINRLFRSHTIMIAAGKAFASMILLFLSAFSYAQDNQLEVGAYTIDITPTEPVIIGAYDRNRLSKGVLDPLYAKAIVVKKYNAKFAIVTIDTIGIGFSDAIKIRKSAAAAVDALEVDSIVVSATHVHTGPDTIGFWGASPTQSGVNHNVLDKIRDAAVLAIITADSRRKPAKLFANESNYEPSWVSNISEPNSLDSKLTVASFKDLQGNTIATLSNFACHPTSIGESDFLSADYLGQFYKNMASKWSGDHLFLQGAIGGWVQPSLEPRGVETAGKIGSDLAGKVSELLSEASYQPVDRVASASRIFSLPLDNPNFAAAISLGVLHRQLEANLMKSEVTLLKVGPLSIATHPGESAPYLAEKTREILTSEFEMVVTLGQDQVGYILRPEFFSKTSKFPHSKYLSSMSPSIESADKMLNAIKAAKETLSK